ncbi:uncharacterized protein At3g27210 [Zea mays]|uniref:uncharacterized protein At3g27210 n=1 Tax=Zea mays TaxID=4577 RepID=UPI0009AAAF1B|nr:uncharacterized protein At3g27210 [Zea mays]|eukprot:XP_008675662.2 uncharacterized protein At3g27210 [Zea mays]
MDVVVLSVFFHRSPVKNWWMADRVTSVGGKFSTVATVIMVLGSSSRDETSFEATPWLESDCEDDFYSVNEDLTPAGSFASRTSGRNTPPPRPRDLPTLAVILKAEPLKPPPPQRRLGDLLREAQDDDNDNDTAVDGLSRDDSLRMGAEANRCCVPRLAWAISCNGRTQRK